MTLHHLLTSLAVPVLWHQYTEDVGLDPADAYTLLACNHGIEDTATTDPVAFIEAIRIANS